MIVQPETNTRASRAKFAATNLLLITSAMLALCVVAAAQESTVTLAGQVVCSDCWSEAKDRVKTPYGNAADLVCAATCAAKGRPASLAVKTGEGNQFALYQLEEGRFKTGAKDWLALMGKQVEATGTMRGEGGKRRLTVDELRVVSDSPAALEAAKMIGTQAELALRDLSGAEQRLSALRGRVVVLNFWATYCAPCRKEMPDLAAIQNDYAAQGVQVVGASSDEAEDRAKVLQFIKETKINFPVWLGATEEHSDVQVPPAVDGWRRVQPARGEGQPARELRRADGDAQAPRRHRRHELRPHRDAFGSVVLRDLQQESEARDEAARRPLRRRRLRHVRGSAARHRRAQRELQRLLVVHDPLRRRARPPARQLRARASRRLARHGARAQPRRELQHFVLSTDKENRR
ncbi:MAG: TlpA family protein disulfide reductase [Acidobacteria bacterium]|nr:TlpA family protein disulfide reductase [Acidobacteriota bacterium]